MRKTSAAQCIFAEFLIKSKNGLCFSEFFRNKKKKQKCEKIWSKNIIFLLIFVGIPRPHPTAFVVSKDVFS